MISRTHRYMAFARSGVATAAAVATLILPPVALVHFVGSPLPDTLPSWQGFTEALERSTISDGAVIKVIAALAWLVWAQLAVALIAEIVAVLRHAQAPRLPTLPGTQAFAGRWVASILLISTPLAVAGAGPRLRLRNPRLRHSPSSRRHPHSLRRQWHADSDSRRRRWHTQLLRPSATRCTVTTAIGRSPGHTSGTGCDGGRSETSTSDTPNRNGTTIQPGSDSIDPGWTLLLPARPDTPAPPDIEDAHVVDDTHVVERGENLWIIAEGRPHRRPRPAPRTRRP